jgi:hypothetical protein
VQVEPNITKEVDHERRRITAVWRGVFEIGTIVNTCRERTKAGLHTYSQFIDARAASIANSPDDSQKVGVVMDRLVSEEKGQAKAGATAILVGSELDYGMCRVIAAYFEPAGDIRVVYNAEEGLRWLDAQG